MGVKEKKEGSTVHLPALVKTHGIHSFDSSPTISLQSDWTGIPPGVAATSRLTEHRVDGGCSVETVSVETSEYTGVGYREYRDIQIQCIRTTYRI